jgi:hypothetical protein
MHNMQRRGVWPSPRAYLLYPEPPPLSFALIPFADVAVRQCAASEVPRGRDTYLLEDDALPLLAAAPPTGPSPALSAASLVRVPFSFSLRRDGRFCV